MGIVIFDTSMSLDGFMAGANVRLEAGLGDDGERLHDWAFHDEAGRALLDREVERLGAVICGRTTYDMSIPHWGPDGPTAGARLPLFVLSHSVPDDVPEGGVYTFVSDLTSAIATARAAAEDKNVAVMGAATAQQAIRQGYVDEISIHLVPVLFGEGLPTFGDLGGDHLALETLDIQQTEHATHLRYRVVRD